MKKSYSVLSDSHKDNSCQNMNFPGLFAFKKFVIET